MPTEKPVHVNERLKEIRARYAPGTLFEYPKDSEKILGPMLLDICFLLAVLDSGDFEFFCNGCRRPFKDVDALTKHPGCTFLMEQVQ